MSYDRAFRREALSAYSWLAVYPEQYLARYLTLPPVPLGPLALARGTDWSTTSPGATMSTTVAHN